MRDRGETGGPPEQILHYLELSAGKLRDVTDISCVVSQAELVQSYTVLSRL